MDLRVVTFTPRKVVVFVLPEGIIMQGIFMSNLSGGIIGFNTGKECHVFKNI